MTVRHFDLVAWSAWADGLVSQKDWLNWAYQPQAIPDGGQPDVRAMPAMLRRRAQRLGRMALETLFAEALQNSDAPIVFCSRHGEVGRSTDLLAELAKQGSVSPQSFSMSVHNAILGLFTIAQKSHSMVTALAAGQQTTLAGLQEAVGLLTDGAPSVRLVYCDEPLPALYADYQDANNSPFACLLELRAGTVFSIQASQTQQAADAATAWPEALEVLRFLLNEQRNELALAGQHVLQRAPK